MKNIILKGLLAVGLTFASIIVFAESADVKLLNEIKNYNVINRSVGELDRFVPDQRRFWKVSSEGKPLMTLGTLIYRLPRSHKRRMLNYHTDRLFITVYWDLEDNCVKGPVSASWLSIGQSSRTEPCSEEEIVTILEHIDINFSNTPVEDLNSAESTESRGVYETCMDKCTTGFAFSSCNQRCLRAVARYVQQQNNM